VSNVPRRGSHILTHSPHSLPLRNCLYGVSIATICLFKVAIPSNSGVQMQSPPAHMCVLATSRLPPQPAKHAHIAAPYIPLPPYYVYAYVYFPKLRQPLKPKSPTRRGGGVYSSIPSPSSSSTGTLTIKFFSPSNFHATASPSVKPASATVVLALSWPEMTCHL
jgi:hypothetical protein